MQARLQALARRRHGLAHSQLTYGPLTIDIDQRSVAIHGEALKLTPKLYELIEFLALRPRQLVTRNALLGHVYGLNDEPNTRVFDVYMCNLRAFLKATDGEVSIETVRGAGFRLHVPDVPEDEVAA
jgi:DNA-binding response OmpR family regulator